MARKKKNQRSLWKRLTRWLLVAGVLWLAVSLVVILVLRWIPPPTSAFMLRQQLAGRAVDYRWVPMARISPQAALAVIASEDQNFFNHWGVDFQAVADAIADNRTRQRPRGASTISQQVAKNLFLWPASSYLRKGFELYFTLLIELSWPKSRILEVYLNVAEMGPGVFGVEAAAERFYAKPAAKLNRREAAMLAAVLPNPRRMSAAHPSNYVVRRTWQIMVQMAHLGGTAFLSSGGR